MKLIKRIERGWFSQTVEPKLNKARLSVHHPMRWNSGAKVQNPELFFEDSEASLKY